MKLLARLACALALASGVSVLAAQTPATPPPAQAAAANASAPAALAGDWGCQVTYQGSVIPVVLHLSLGKDGALVASMDNVMDPSGGSLDASITVHTDVVHIDVPALPSSFDGKLNASFDAMDGSWSYDGENIGCTMTKAAGN